MFIRASTIVFSVAALAGFAAAVPATLDARTKACNAGNVQCCKSVQKSNSIVIDTLFEYLGLPVPPAGTQVGVTCSPVTVDGTGSGATCTQQTVCCKGDTFNGNIVTGCSPITINA